ncbi:MAG: hypothetical protein PHC30_07280, partial [Lentisphaeria bacterium]|nr:hypothetical protein [Lentisphaeria bacterium]
MNANEHETSKISPDLAAPVAAPEETLITVPGVFDDVDRPEMTATDAASAADPETPVATTVDDKPAPATEEPATEEPAAEEPATEEPAAEE